MSHVTLPTRDTAPAASQPVLAQIHAAFGTVPNMFRAAAHSPAALQFLWAGLGALGGGSLPAKLGEQVAVAIADRNACGYCLSAHTALGRKAGASVDEMAAAQAGRSDDPRTAAALTFALKLLDARGAVSAADVAALRAAGFDDGQVVELIAHVALNVFTNTLNVALAVPVDFPVVKLRRAA